MTELAGLIALHCLLGLGLAAAVWSVGLGWMLLALPRSRSLSHRHAVFGYPVGLLAAVTSSLALLASPWLAPAALALVALGLVALMRGRARLGSWIGRALVPVGWAFPFVVGLPFALGLVLHGPTGEVPSSAYGDYVFWATRTVSAEGSIAPFEDLLVADRNAAYVEGGSTFIGAALSHLPGFDVFLFQTTALPALMLASLCFGLALLFGRRDQEGDTAAGRAVLLATLATATIAYPSWLTESPPVALAVPLSFALYAIWRERLPLSALAVLAAVLLLDLYMTKGFVVLVLAVGLGVALVRDHRDELRRLVTPARLLGAPIAVGLALLVLWRLDLLRGQTATLPQASFEFIPAEAARGLFDQLHGRDTQAVAPAFAVAGELLLGLALYRIRAWTNLAALVVGLIASWTIVGYGFDLVVGVAVLLAVLLFRSQPELLESRPRIVVPAALCLAISAWFRDTSGYQAGFVFVLLLGAAVLAAFLAIDRARRAYAHSLGAIAAALLLGLSGRPFVGLLVLTAAAGLAPLVARLAPDFGRALRPALALSLAGSVAIAAVAIARDDFRISEQPVTLTTDHYDIWRRVNRLVPPNGLVFTSMTGEVIDGDRGWNYYPGIAGRQLYIGGWYDGPLLVEPGERARRLDRNRAILGGRMDPEREVVARRHDAYFAVIRTRERAPSSFRLLYRNGRFELYRIPS